MTDQQRWQNFSAGVFWTILGFWVVALIYGMYGLLFWALLKFVLKFF